MAVRALGAGQLVDSEGTWPTNYVNFANENKILDDVNAIYTAVSTRMQAATIVANTLEADMWAKTGVKSNGEIEWSKQTGHKMYKDILKLNDLAAVPCTKVSLKDSKFNTTDVKDFDLSGIKVGLSYEGWVNEDNDIVCLWESKNYKSVKFTEIKKIDNTDKDQITLVVDDKEVAYDAKTSAAHTFDVDYFYNQVQDDSALATSDNVFGTAYIVNDEIVSIYAEEYTSYGIVDEVTTNKIKFLSTSDAKGATKTGSLVTNDEDVDYVVMKDGKSVGLEGIKSGDALFFYHITDSSLDEKYVMEINTNVVKGEVTAKKSGKVYIDKVKYDTALSMNLEDEVTAYLNKAGDIVMFELEDEAASETALVSYIRKINGKNVGSYGYDVVLTYMDGTKSDVLSLDLIDTYDEKYTTWADGTPSSAKEAAIVAKVDADIAAATVSTKFQGFPVNYEVSGDKVTFKPLTSDVEYRDVTATSALTVGNKNVTIAQGAVAGVTGYVYVTSSTKLLKVKEDDEYGIKVESIDFDDLDNSVFNGKSYVIGYDETTKAADAIIFGNNSTVKRSADLRLGFVVDSLSAKYDKKAAQLVTIQWQDGSKEQFYTNSDLTNGSVAIGDYKDFKVKDDVITDADAVAAPEAVTAGPTGIITEFVEDKDEITIGGVTKTLADDVVILAIDKDSDDTFTYAATSAYSYKKLSASDLEAIDFAEDSTYYVLNSKDFKDADNNHEIKFMVVFNKDLVNIGVDELADAFAEIAKLAKYDAVSDGTNTVTITIAITENVAAGATITVEGVTLTCSAGVTYAAGTTETADFTITFA